MRFSFVSPVWTLCRRGILTILLGQALASTVGVVDQLAAAGLSATANASLGYANRLIALATALGATVIARALLPVLCELDSRDPARAGMVTRRWGLLVFGSSLAGIVVIWFAAEPSVRLLFQHGAFTAADTQRVASVLRAGLLQLPPYLTGMVAVQLLTSRMKYGVLLGTSATILFVKIVLNALLIPIFGLQGVMFSTAGMYLVSGVALWIVALRPARNAGAAP
jgi:peptidoglycan biosynthesis protein MviN/MurJ (putative lipid II flippase)